MAGGTAVFHRTINSKASLGRREQKQQQHQKQNPSEGKTLGLSGSKEIRVFEISLTPPTSS
jgi:hypothetical protein